MDSPPDDLRTKFKRRADARPDEILDAALDLFTRNGFAATRVEDIAAKAGISKATIYLYFPSKTALLEGLVRRAVVPVARQALESLEQSQGSARAALSMLLGIVADAISDPRIVAVPMLVMREASAFPEIGAIYRREVVDRVRPGLVGLVRRGIEQGEFRAIDPEMAVRSVIGPILAHALLARVLGIGGSDRAAMEAFVAQHRSILGHGLLLNAEDAF